VTLLFDPEVTTTEFSGRRVTIVGLGKGRTTGGLARYLVEAGAKVTVSDPKKHDELSEGIARLGDLPVELVLGPSSDDAALADPDFVFVTPGIRPRSPTILRAIQRDIPILTEMGVFFRLCPAPIVGITGTKGKSTTTTLVSRMLGRGTRRVVTGGNIGTAVIQELGSIGRDDIVVLELSSFQLETLGHSPHVAVVTNVLEDHLDHHGTREAYVNAKSNIVRWQGPRDVAVLNLDDPGSLGLHTGAPSELRGYSLALRTRRGAYLDAAGVLTLASATGPLPICAASELRIPGRHNIANALAAAVAADALGIGVAEIADVIRSFEGLPHRLETVAEIDGVLWVNDSQGTTPYATIPALTAHGRTPVVILGGVAKGADFAELGREVVRVARGAVLIGQAADEIAGAISAARTPKSRVPPGGSSVPPGGSSVPLGTSSGPIVERAGSLAEAVAQARAMARPGDVVLLSPAAATAAGRDRALDPFTSYEERGEAFRALVREMAR